MPDLQLFIENVLTRCRYAGGGVAVHVPIFLEKCFPKPTEEAIPAITSASMAKGAQQQQQQQPKQIAM